MIRQRQESARAYEEGGRLDLADAGAAGDRHHPRVHAAADDASTEVEKAVAAAIAETGACSVRDMGKVMATLKARHAGKMDFSRAGRGDQAGVPLSRGFARPPVLVAEIAKTGRRS